MTELTDDEKKLIMKMIFREIRKIDFVSKYSKLEQDLMISILEKFDREKRSPLCGS